DIEAGAEPQIVGSGGIPGHAFAARAGIRRDEDQAEFGAGPAKFGLLGDVGVGAGQTRQIPDHRELRAALMRRYIDRKGHAGSGLAACMLVDALQTAMRSIEGNCFDRHDVMALVLATCLSISSDCLRSPTARVRRTSVRPISGA